MIRLLILGLLVVAAALAYPWVALAVAVIGVAILAASHRRRSVIRNSQFATVNPSEHVSLERRVALRRARAELRSIERGAGLDPGA